MLFSGSIGGRITASEAYQGVCIEIVDASAGSSNPGQHKYLQFRSVDPDTGEARFRVQTDEFYFGKDRTQPNAQFISGSEGKIEISSSNFHLDNDGSIIMQGTITAEAGGTIGGFTLGGSSMFSGTQPVPTFFLSGSGHSGANFVKRNLFISSSGFQVNAQGAISASVGRIGGFTITDTQLSAGDDSDFFGVIPGTGIQMGDSTFSDAKFSVTNAGALKSISGTIGGFTIADGTLTGGNVQLAAAGTIKVGSVADATTTATTNAGFFADNSGNVLIKGNVNGDDYIKVTGGGGIDIKANDFDLNAGSGKLIIESSTPSISLTDATAKFIVGNLDSVTDTSDGDKGIYAQGDGKLLIKEDASNYIQFNGGLDIKTETFKLDTDRLDIDSSTSRISVFDDAGSPKERIRIGEVDGGSVFGMKIFDGTGTADADILVEFGEGGNKIGGWTISDTTISSNNLILNSVGLVETSDYVSGLKGFRLSSQNNGFLEVENAKIRGTLRTTVFEKESVNAVGGQLQVGNATTITGSAQISATATTIPVENVTGFTGSEIILAKKVGNTGFSTEYMLITSQSRRDSSSNTDFSGSLFVVRGYSGSNPVASTISSSLGDTAQPGTTLEPGQVLVSTGHFNAATTSGSGYIRLNANPNDIVTPYIDIVERTGSKIYEVDLKARLGDLSGLPSAKVGAHNPGFGLFTERAFLTKDVTIGTLGSEHILLSDSSLLFKNGTNVRAQLDADTWTLGGATGTTTDAIKIAAGGVFIYDNSVDYVSITSAGLSVFEGDASNPVAVFGTDATVGLDEAGKSNVFVV